MKDEKTGQVTIFKKKKAKGRMPQTPSFGSQPSQQDEISNMIAPLAQGAEDIRFPRLKQVLERTMPAYVRVLTRKHGATGLRAGTGLQEAISKSSPFLRKGVDVRGLCDLCST